MSVRQRPDPDAGPGLQLTWLDGDVMAWQPSRSAYGGNIQAAVVRTLRTGPGTGVGAIRVAKLYLPDGPASVMCQRIEIGALAALGRNGALDATASPSIGWFAAAWKLADAVVRAGQMMPWLSSEGIGWWNATWRPVRAHLDPALAELVATMPPVVAAGLADRSHQEALVDIAEAVVCGFVDQITRLSLQYHGWHSDLTDTRGAAARATRQVARALSSPQHRFVSEGDIDAAVGQIALLFDQFGRRADGEPVVRARLRLDLPEHPQGRWPLQLELVDIADAGRWCSAADVVAGTELAAELAGSDRGMATLASQLHLARTAIAEAAPWLHEWLDSAADADPVAVGEGRYLDDGGIDIDTAAATLAGVERLAEAHISLSSPERLTRRTPGARGSARVADTNTDGTGKFGTKALVDWQMVIDGTPIDEAALRRAAEAASALIDVGGRWVEVSQADARRALANLAHHRAEHDELTPLELLQLAAEFASEGWANAAADTAIAELNGDDTSSIDADGWLAQLLAGLPDTSLEEGIEPPEFTATLRPYQRRGLGWLQFLHRLGLGGCLADDMGLGKTPTTLAHLASLPGPHLVLCPLSVVRNWQRETARFVPSMRVHVHHGTDRADADAFTQVVGSHDLIISTYQVAVRDADMLGTVAWRTAVFDEAQAFKNPDTRTAKVVRAIPAQQRIALTGTPVENRLSELWSILNTVAPGLLGNQVQFRNRFAAPIEREHDAVAVAALRQITGPFLLRRTKADRSLVPDLPDKVEQVAWAPLTREQATMYQAVVDQLLTDADAATGMQRRGLVLAALTRLKQICNHPAHALGDGSKLAGRSGKLARFDELVTDLHDAGEQALVFTQFREMGLLLQRHLSERFNMQAPFLHGGVPKAARDRMVDAFQSGLHGTHDAPQLLIVSLKAGGTGLNLTAASRVVHYDRWWNPAVEDQATDRAWRIGQQQSVFVHKLVCEGTIEERVDSLINDKRALANAVVGQAGETWLSELSTDELRQLVMFHPSARGI